MPSRLCLGWGLQAESDRRLYEEYVKQREEEAELMKHVKGWSVDEGVYKTRWMPRYYQDVEPGAKK